MFPHPISPPLEAADSGSSGMINVGEGEFVKGHGDTLQIEREIRQRRTPRARNFGWHVADDR